jgi:hypothetical protein
MESPGETVVYATTTVYSGRDRSIPAVGEVTAEYLVGFRPAR